MEELIKNNVALSCLSFLLTGFLAGLATYKAILEIAHLKIISLSQWDSIQALLGGGGATSHAARATDLNEGEKALLRELVAESKGIGDSVAVYPFESNIRRLGLTKESANTSIASLQDRGFVVLGEDIGHDDVRERPSAYPVYRITKEGFRWAIQNRS